MTHPHFSVAALALLSSIFAEMKPTSGEASSCANGYQTSPHDHSGTWPFASMYVYDRKSRKCKEVPSDSLPKDSLGQAYSYKYECYFACTRDQPAPVKCYAEPYKRCPECGERGYYYDSNNQKCIPYGTKADSWFPPDGANCFGDKTTCLRECMGFNENNKNGFPATK
ncbi:uncharacterized protein LOC142563065 [Dermacentor variabilis]|uniref:uncharacterized protein LOC142563065 n=1 Tax=Dermacentor variabilis TaxID=34621 RepID=UPI003F5B56BF